MNALPDVELAWMPVGPGFEDGYGLREGEIGVVPVRDGVAGGCFGLLEGLKEVEVEFLAGFATYMSGEVRYLAGLREKGGGRYLCCPVLRRVHGTRSVPIRID